MYVIGFLIGISLKCKSYSNSHTLTHKHILSLSLSLFVFITEIVVVFSVESIYFLFYFFIGSCWFLFTTTILCHKESQVATLKHRIFRNSKRNKTFCNLYHFIKLISDHCCFFKFLFLRIISHYNNNKFIIKRSMKIQQTITHIRGLFRRHITTYLSRVATSSSCMRFPHKSVH